MPLTRILAYRDRFVEQLVQTMTGGSSALPPVQFEPGVETPVLVTFTEETWREVFSALMTGADLTYPEKAHEVVWHLLKQIEYPMPVQTPGIAFIFDLWARFMASNGAAWTSTDTAFMYFSHVMTSPLPHNVVGRVLFKDIYFTAGEYRATVTYAKTTSCGIATLTNSVPGSGIVNNILSVDQNGLFNAEFITSGDFTLDVDGIQRIVFGNGGSTTSGSYQQTLSSIHIERLS